MSSNASSPLSHPISGRKRQILHAIVDAYLESGEPVASSAVSQRHFPGSAPSPATIRNAMAELSELGYLTQSHASAGRVPTASAIQDFVDSLPAVRPHSAEVHRLSRQFQARESWPDRIQQGSHLLTELTHQLGIAAALPSESQILHQLELIPLADRQYLMVVVTADHHVHNQLVRLDIDLSPVDLTQIRNYLNEEFRGWSISDARRELERRLEDERSEYRNLLASIEHFYSRGLLEFGLGPLVFLDGAAYLLGLDLQITRERLRELFQALEQKKKILDLLDQFLKTTDSRPAVKVGLAEAHPALEDFSLVGMQVTLAPGMSARIAVLGPLRLNYPRTMAAVLEVGQALSPAPQG